METSCPVTGLTVLGRPEWSRLSLDASFDVTYRTIGDHILLCCPRGNPQEIDWARFQEIRQHVLTESGLEETPYIELQDCSLLGGMFASRKLASISWQDPNCLNILQFGRFWRTRWCRSMGRSLRWWRRQRLFLKDYAQAVTRALSLQAEKRTAALHKKEILGAMRESGDVETMIREFTSQLLVDSSRPEEVKAAVPEVIGRAIDADHVVLLEFSEDGTCLVPTHYWHQAKAPKLPFETMTFSSPSLVWSVQPPLLNWSGNTGDLPFEASTIRRVLQFHQVQKVGILPLMISEELTGYFLVLSHRKVWRWKASHVNLLLILINVLAHFFARSLAESLMQEARCEMERQYKKRAEQLTTLYQEAERANRSKSEFLANISHEIRTPLNAIIGFGEILREQMAREKADQRSRDYMARILGESTRLFALINNVLDLANIESGRLDLRPKSFYLHRMLEKTTSSFHPEAIEKQIEFRTIIGDDVPEYIVGDEVRLMQVLVNLLSNALKFTDQGSVRLEVDQLACREERSLLRFSVTDTGKGIAAERVENVFNQFEQVDGSWTRRFGGVGLGSAIAKELVDLMGGTLKVESTEGKGSRFWFDIWLERSSQVTQTKMGMDVDSMKELLAGRRFLVAEDYPPNQDVVRENLHRLGCEVDIAENGKEAVALYGCKEYDMVLMDLQMPEMNGFEATRHIRAMLDRKSVPIIALTANVSSSDRQKCLDAGMNDMLAKPLRRRTLLNFLSEYFLEKVTPEALHSGANADDSVSSENEPAGSQTADPLGEMLPVDFERFSEEEFDGDRVVAEQIIVSMMDLIPGQLRQIRQAMDQKDTTTIVEQAHAIKGGASNIMAEPMRQTALRLEKAANSGDIEEIQILVNDMEKRLDDLRKWFATLEL
jgi:signal transduction histidine kinase/CheY-like chemotaxis protein